MCAYDDWKLASPEDDVACDEDWDLCECGESDDPTVDDKAERLSGLRCMRGDQG